MGSAMKASQDAKNAVNLVLIVRTRSSRLGCLIKAGHFSSMEAPDRTKGVAGRGPPTGRQAP